MWQACWDRVQQIAGGGPGGPRTADERMWLEKTAALRAQADHLTGAEQ
ncbi:hypothetical protein [Streptomyces sp. NPDC058657]